MHHSLNSARQTLRVGKVRLYGYLDSLGIEPILKGNSKLISDEQLKEIRKVIQEEALSQKKSEDSPQNSPYKTKTVSEDKQGCSETILQNNQNINTTHSDLRDEIVHLRKLLESEQQERQEKDKRHNEVLKEFNQSTERFQAMLLQLQTRNNELNQKLLESPTEGPEVHVRKETFTDSEVVPEQLRQPQNNLLTPVVVFVATTVLIVTAFEFGGFSVREFVENLLPSRML